jgi:hypothetical protein
MRRVVNALPQQVGHLRRQAGFVKAEVALPQFIPLWAVGVEGAADLMVRGGHVGCYPVYAMLNYILPRPVPADKIPSPPAAMASLRLAGISILYARIAYRVISPG